MDDNNTVVPSKQENIMFDAFVMKRQLEYHRTLFLPMPTDNFSVFRLHYGLFLERISINVMEEYDNQRSRRRVNRR